MKSISCNGINIGPEYPPFIIAEMSGNHNQSLDRALELVDAAASTGASALKIQTYTPDTMTIDVKDGDFLITDKKSPWTGRSLYELYEEAHTPWEWHSAIIERAKKHGMIVFSTPFDETAVDFLEEFDLPLYKIASFENIDLALIKKVAKTGKPMIVSTGMASYSNIEDIVRTVKEAGNDNLILLKCTSSYPADPSSSNIRSIQTLKRMFDCQIGLSDHTLGVGVAAGSIALGATVVEKHFTLSRADGGVDAAFSLEKDEFKLLVDECNRAWQSLGKTSIGLQESEKSSTVFRRSIYITQDIAEGDVLTTENTRVIRPGYGIAPKNLDIVLGKKVNRGLKRGTSLQWDYLS